MTKKNGWSLSFEIPGKPESKENSMGRAKNGVMFKVKKYKDWELNTHLLAIEAMKEAGWPGPFSGRCIIAADFRFADWAKRDLTNFWKSLCDSFNGAVWIDDCQVDGSMSIRSIDRKNPGIEVFVWFLNHDWDDYNRKYPERYEKMKMVGLVMGTDIPFVHVPEEGKPKMFGKYIYDVVGKGTRSEKVPVKMDRGRSPHDQAKAKAELSANGQKNCRASKKSTARGSGSS